VRINNRPAALRAFIFLPAASHVRAPLRAITIRFRGLDWPTRFSKFGLSSIAVRIEIALVEIQIISPQRDSLRITLLSAKAKGRMICRKLAISRLIIADKAHADIEIAGGRFDLVIVAMTRSQWVWPWRDAAFDKRPRFGIDFAAIYVSVKLFAKFRNSFPCEALYEFRCAGHQSRKTQYCRCYIAHHIDRFERLFGVISAV